MQKKFLRFLLGCFAFVTTNVMAASYTYMLVNKLPAALVLDMAICTDYGEQCTRGSETIQPGQTVHKVLPAPPPHRFWAIRAMQGSGGNRRAVFSPTCIVAIGQHIPRGILLFQPFDDDDIMCIPAAK